MIITPYKPPAISQTDIDIFNELILSKRLLGVSSDQEGNVLRFLESSAVNLSPLAFSFSLQADQARMEITLELQPESSLAKRLKEVGGIESVPEEFKTALMGFCSSKIIDSLEHLLKLPITLGDESHANDSSKENKTLFFEVLSMQEVSQAYGKITLPLALLRRILSAAKQKPPVKRDSLSQVLLQGGLIVGEATLSLHQWEKLIPGDLIFLEEPSTLTSGEGKFLLKKGGLLPVTFDAAQFQPLILALEEIFPEGFQPATSNSPEEFCSEKEENFLELKVSAGDIALTIDEVLHLGATQSIEQEIKVSRPLEILTQEKSLGSGELVKISDRYAIVITQLKN